MKLRVCMSILKKSYLFSVSNLCVCQRWIMIFRYKPFVYARTSESCESWEKCELSINRSEKINFPCFASLALARWSHIWHKFAYEINSQDSRCVIFQRNVDVNRLICLSLLRGKLLSGGFKFSITWTQELQCMKKVVQTFSLKILSRKSTEDFLRRLENQFSALSSIDSIFFSGSVCLDTPRWV